MMDTSEKDFLVIVSFSTKTNVLTLISCYDGSKRIISIHIEILFSSPTKFFFFFLYLQQDLLLVNPFQGE